jgi:Putative peptidoglycan binding domain
MLTMKNLFFLFLCLSANTVGAQTRVCTQYIRNAYTDSTFMGLPNPEEGSLYARCWIGSEYENFPDSNFTVTPPISTVKPPARFRVIEPVIEDVIDSVIEKRGTSEWILKIKQNKRIRILPPVYTTTTSAKEISPAFTRWTLARGDMNGLSQNPDDCTVFAFVEVPARYLTTTTRTELKPPRKIVGKDTLNLDSTELKRFGTVRIFTHKTTYYHQVLKSKGEVVVYDHYYDIKHPSPTKKLVRKGGFSEWKKCLCGCSRNGTRHPLHVQNVQKALKTRGYYKGKINNILDTKTKAAVVEFQKDNGLSIGSFDLQTMKALGVSAFD